MITGDSTRFKTTVSQVNKSLGDMTRKSQEATASMLSGFKKLATGIAALGIGKLISSSISSAMNAVESESLFEISMGSYVDTARKWSDELEKSLGLNGYALRSNLGTLYNMTTSMGLASDSAYDLSTGVVELANDMASFYNLGTDEAFAKLRSGLTGEAEPLKALGILIDDMTIKEYAYKTGIAAVGAELTQQQKVMARYEAILAQTSNAQGDIARTIDSPANKLRRLQTEFERTKIEIGNALLPAVNEILPLLSNALQAVTPYIVKLAEGFNAVAAYLTSLSPEAKRFIEVCAGVAVAIAAITKAVQALSAAKAVLNALSGPVGWVALGVGAVAVGATAINRVSKKNNKEDTSAATAAMMTEYLNSKLSGTTSEAATASEALSGVADSTNEITRAVQNLTSIDEINTLNNGENSGGILQDIYGDIDDLVGYSDKVVSIVEKTKNKITSLYKKASDEVAGGNLDSAQSLIEEARILEKLNDWTEDGKAIAGNAMDDWKAKMLENVSFFEWTVESQKADILGMAYQVKDELEDSYNTIAQTVANADTDLGISSNNIVTNFAKMYDVAVKTKSAFAELFEHKNSVPEMFTDIYKANQILESKSKMEQVGIATSENGIPSVFLRSGRFSLRANGGFPDYGEIFIARENGPELVGTLGGRTAVANEMQIETALEKAISKAFGKSSAAEKTICVICELDGNEVGRAAAKYQERQNMRRG